MTDEKNILINQSIRKKNSRVFIAIFFVFFAIIIAYFGKWKGFVIEMSDPNLDNTNSLFLITISGIWGIIYLILKDKIFFSVPYKKTLFAFFITLFLICFFRDDIGKSLRNFISILLTYGFVFFLVSLLKSISIKKTNMILSICIFLSICLSMYIHFTKIGPLRFFEHDDPFVRMGGLFYYGNIGIISGLLAILGIIGISLEKKIMQKIFYFFCICLGLISLGLSDSRSGLLGLFCSACYIAIINRKRISNGLKIFVTLIIASLAIFYFSYYRENTSGGSTDMYSLNYRLKIWELSWNGIMKEPITGYGSTSYLANSIDARSYDSRLNDAHSAILGLSLQSGLIATGLFLIYYLKLAINFVKKSSQKVFFTITIFWFIASFFWGDIFLGTAGFIQIMFGVFVLTYLTHPDFYEENRLSKN